MHEGGAGSLSGRHVVAGPEGGLRPPAGPALRRVEVVVTTGNRSADCLVSQRRAANAANAGTSAILSWSRCSQRMPGGRCGSARQMASSGVTMRSTRKSWMVSGRGSFTTCSWWTVVASTVSAGSRRPQLGRQPRGLRILRPCRREHPRGSRPRCRRRPGPPMAARWLRPSSQPWPRLPWWPPPMGRC